MQVEDEEVMDKLKWFMYKGKRIEIGDPIRIPSTPGKRDGFKSTIKAIEGKDGKVVGISVINPKTGGIYTFPPSRVQPYLRKSSAAKAIGKSAVSEKKAEEERKQGARDAAKVVRSIPTGGLRRDDGTIMPVKGVQRPSTKAGRKPLGMTSLGELLP
jgi:hypothetical protein